MRNLLIILIFLVRPTTAYYDDDQSDHGHSNECVAQHFLCDFHFFPNLIYAWPILHVVRLCIRHIDLNDLELVTSLRVCLARC